MIKHFLYLMLAVSAVLFTEVEICDAKPRRKAWVYLSAYRSTFSDLQLSGGEGEPPVEIASTLDIEAAFRIHSIFNIVMFTGQSEDGLKKESGIGGRVDLPGTFFLGAKSSDLRKRAKRYPINTSIYVMSTHVSEMDVTQTSETIALGVRYGISMDAFLFNPLTYLTINAGAFTFSGNAFFMHGVGLGIQF